MTRPRTVTDHAILEAVRHCAVERGPAVALDVIADRVGISPPALLKRFGSREKLMIAALRPSDPPAWLRELEAGDGPEHGPGARPFEEQLRALIERVLDFFLRETPCMTALSESGFAVEKIFGDKEVPPPVRNIWALGRWFQRAEERGLIDPHAMGHDDFEGVAMSLLGALHGRVFLSDFIGSSFWRRDNAAYVADLARIYARALAPVRDAPHKPVAKAGPVAKLRLVSTVKRSTKSVPSKSSNTSSSSNFSNSNRPKRKKS